MIGWLMTLPLIVFDKTIMDTTVNIIVNIMAVIHYESLFPLYYSPLLTIDYQPIFPINGQPITIIMVNYNIW